MVSQRSFEIPLIAMRYHNEGKKCRVISPSGKLSLSWLLTLCCVDVQIENVIAFQGKLMKEKVSVTTA